MPQFIAYASQIALALVVSIGLIFLAVGLMWAIDHAYSRYLMYRGLWPVVLRALREHALKESEKD